MVRYTHLGLIWDKSLQKRKCNPRNLRFWYRFLWAPYHFAWYVQSGIWHEHFKTTIMNANFEHPSYLLYILHLYTIPSSVQLHPSQKDCQSVIVYVSIRLHQDTIGKCTCHRPPGMAGWPMDSWLVFSHALVSASPPPWSTKKMQTNTLRKIVACLKQYLPQKKCNMLSPYSQTSIQASLPEWLVFAPWTNLHLRSTHKSPNHFTAKKDEVPRKLHKKTGVFDTILRISKVQGN